MNTTKGSVRSKIRPSKDNTTGKTPAVNKAGGLHLVQKGIPKDRSEIVQTDPSKIEHMMVRVMEAQNIDSLGYWDIYYLSGSVTWSQEVFKILELDQETTEETLELFFEYVHPEDVE